MADRALGELRGVAALVLRIAVVVPQRRVAAGRLGVVADEEIRAGLYSACRVPLHALSRYGR